MKNLSNFHYQGEELLEKIQKSCYASSILKLLNVVGTEMVFQYTF